VANLALVFDLLAKDNASGAFRNVGNAAETAGTRTSKFGTAVAGAMKLAAGAFLGAGLVQGFKALYEAADESRKIAALTGAVIKSTGGAANISAGQVGDLAAAIAKKTGVDDEAIQSGENLLLTFTNIKNQAGAGNDIFTQTTKIMTDMSVALGTDASGSAIQLGKALNDPIKGVTALTRVGVSFTEQQKDQIKTLVESGDTLGAQKIILAELGKEFGGAAEAAATPLGKLQQRVGDLAEQVGGYLIPMVDKAATFFMDKLLPAFEDIGGAVMGVAIPAVKALATVVGAVADAFNALPGPLQAGVIALGAFAVLKGPVSGALETIGLKALYMKDAITSVGTGIGGFKAAGAGLLGFLGGPWGLAIAGATVGLSLLVSWLSKSDEGAEDAAAAQTNLAQALEQTNGVIDLTVRKAAAKDLQDKHLLEWADDLGVQASVMTDALLGVPGALDRVNEAFTAYVNGQKEQIPTTTGVVVEGFSQQGHAALDAQSKFASLAEVTGKTASSQQELAEASGATGGAMQTFAAEIEASRDALSEAKQAIDDFKLSLDILTGESVSLIQVESALQDALGDAEGAMDDLGGAVLNSAGTLNLQSENGRKAADVLLDVRNSGNDLIATLIQQGATADVVAKRDADLRASFIATAGQMGITGVNADRLADQILGIPGSRNTVITADTGQATGAVSHLQTLIDSLRGKTVYIDAVTRGASAVGNALKGFGFAGGGYTGNGGKFEPAGIVHRREFVFPSEAVDRIGVPKLAAMAGLPGYAGGGLVGGDRSALAASATPMVHIDNYNAGGQSPMETAEALSWLARSRG
jgi:hypothetical protein